MPKNLSAATTRTRSLTAIASRRRLLLTQSELIESPESRLRYRIGPLLGQGGVGQVYLSARLGRSSSVPRGRVHQGQRAHRWLVARSVFRAAAGQSSARDSSLRLLSSHDDDGQVLYCLALDALVMASQPLSAPSAKPWAEATVRREIAGILQVLDQAASRSVVAPRSHPAERICV